SSFLSHVQNSSCAFGSNWRLLALCRLVLKFKYHSKHRDWAIAGRAPAKGRYQSGSSSKAGVRVLALPLVDLIGRLQVDRLPLALDDACANLRRRLAGLGLLVAVVDLFQASGALGPMRILEAGVQAFVAHAVAIAIAGLLMDHVGNLGR